MDTAKYMTRWLKKFEERYKEDENGCWIWTGSYNTRGQPQISLSIKITGEKHYNDVAYRHAYRVFKGPIGKGLEIDHTCFNAVCVNPDHLEAVTPDENKERAYQEYYERDECKHGHKLEGNNVYNRPDGRKACRKCRNDTATKWYYDNKAK